MGAFLHLRWSHNLYQQPNPWSIIDPALAVVSERRSWLARIEPATGSVRWVAKVDNPWGSTACTAQRVFYLGSNLRCLDRESGDVRWDYNPPENYIGNVAATATSVLIGGWRGYTPLRSLDADTGKTQWVYPQTRNMQNPLPGPWGIAVVDVGTRTADDPSARLMLLREDGLIGSTFPMPAPMINTDRGTSLQAHADRLITVTRDGGVFVLDPRNDNSWIQVVAHPAGIMAVGRVESGDTLLFHDGDRRICAFDLRAGAMRWIGPRTAYRWSGFPAVELPGGRWIVRTNIGEVSLLSPDGAVLARQTIAQRISTGLALTANGLLVAGTKGALAGYELRDPAG
ncbi:MAG TPA: PQQ-binding-like beta-propeller repeat protein [Herpetosiphonaceae bacterium]|nr:PQQ-binding-like beta-propeller repeat protein [Herpetosiphonaceae bacterium]